MFMKHTVVVYIPKLVLLPPLRFSQFVGLLTEMTQEEEWEGERGSRKWYVGMLTETNWEEYTEELREAIGKWRRRAAMGKTERRPKIV